MQDVVVVVIFVVVVVVVVFVFLLFLLLINLIVVVVVWLHSREESIQFEGVIKVGVQEEQQEGEKGTQKADDG
jgi:fatty acid desaturase